MCRGCTSALSLASRKRKPPELAQGGQREEAKGHESVAVLPFLCRGRHCLSAECDVARCPPRLRAGLGERQEQDMLGVSTAERPRRCTQVVHCPLPPSRGFRPSPWSSRRGRGRRRSSGSSRIGNYRSGSSDDSAAVHSCWLLQGYFYPGLWHVHSRRTTVCCLAPPHGGDRFVHVGRSFRFSLPTGQVCELLLVNVSASTIHLSYFLSSIFV